MFIQKTNIKDKIEKSTTSHHIDVTLFNSYIAEKVTELPFSFFPDNVSDPITRVYTLTTGIKASSLMGQLLTLSLIHNTRNVHATLWGVPRVIHVGIDLSSIQRGTPCQQFTY